MMDIMQVLEEKKARLQRLQAEMDQLVSEIDVLTKAVEIMQKQAPVAEQRAAASGELLRHAAAVGPQQVPPPTDIRKRFP